MFVSVFAFPSFRYLTLCRRFCIVDLRLTRYESVDLLEAISPHAARLLLGNGAFDLLRATRRKEAVEEAADAGLAMACWLRGGRGEHMLGVSRTENAHE